MNRRIVFNMIGKMLLSEAVLLLLPTAVSLYYGESIVFSFLVAMFAAAILGGALFFFSKPKNNVIYAKEGFVIVAFAWIFMSAIGALPLYLSNEIPSYIDAFFETVSGLTTTGASILKDVEALSKGALFWRSFTHWVGGMGVLVFVMAILPSATDRPIHLIRAEMPGPIIGKLLPRAKDTAKILYIIYIVMTCVEIILLKLGGMSFFDSVVHSFGTAGTGGFGIKSDSIGSYSPYSQWIITIFMLIFGINFNLYYLIIIKKLKTALKSVELWVYFAIIGISIIFISINIFPIYKNLSDTVRHSAFQIASIVTTTGYSTTDFNQWPEFSKGILFILMFIGGCAGSTAGGFKLSRVVMLFSKLRNEFKRMLHPRSVSVVKFEDKKVDNATISGISIYLFIYIVCILLIFLLLCLDKFDFTTNFTATVSCFNNVGPGFSAVGPMASYAEYSAFSKVVLSFAMLLGRLEIFPILIALSPATWSKK